MILPAVQAGGRPRIDVWEVLPGLELAFEVEPLGMIFGLVASGLWIVTTFYSIGYMRGHHEKNQTRFYICFAIAISGALGVAFAANVFTLFVFYELITLSTFPLVTHSGTKEARNAGRMYLGILMGTSIAFLLLALVWTWLATGTTEFTPGGILAGKVEGTPLMILLALYAFGTGKAALMPFHRWLPAAMVAPTPVSALLHAVAVVKAGVFTILKVVVYVFGIDLLAATDASRWLTWVAAFTIVAASCVALGKDNLKARLAYSTISQLSYIVLGAALATTAGVHGRRDAHRHARRRQDHPLLLRRRHHGRRAQDRDQRDGRPRAEDALHLRRLPARFAERHRTAAHGRIVEQVVPHARCGRGRAVGHDGRAHGEFAAFASAI